MSDAAPGSQTPDELRDLLLAWINTDSWNESQEVLRANAQRLLSDEALQELDTLLAESNGEDGEDKRTVLQQHRTLLETARSESIDAAYAELLKPSPLTLVMQTLPIEFREAVQAMIEVKNSAELLEQVSQHPILLTQEATTALETLMDDLQKAGQDGTVRFIRERYDGLKQIIEAQHSRLTRALNALLNATPTTLHKVIVQHSILLDEETLDIFAEMAARIEQDGNPAMAQRLLLLLDEIGRIKQAVPDSTVSYPYSQEPYDYERVRIEASEGSFAAENVVNSNITMNNFGGNTQPNKQWQRPARPRLQKSFVGRQDELNTLLTYLKTGESVAITATLQGMGGIGKTFLARKLGMELHSDFPGGVIWIDVGPGVSNEASIQVPLRQLASYAFGGTQPIGQLSPEVVAAWLEEMAPGRLLVILDDVWSQTPLLILDQVLPGDTVRLITTRYVNVGRAVKGKIFFLDRLTLQDGLALLEDRLDCQGDMTYREALEALVSLLDGHALALDIAAARVEKPERVQSRTYDPAAARSKKLEQVQSILNDLKQGIGQGELADLRLSPGEVREVNLEASLALSYRYMTHEQKQRFRALGVFSPETPITPDASAAIWRLEDENIAGKALSELADLALLTQVEGPIETYYRQHGLLQVYAHALLEKEKELTSASWAHAQYYTDMVWRAEMATPKDYSLLDQHIKNLLAALEWAVANEPILFSRLVEGSEQFLRLRGQLSLLQEYLPKAEKIAASTGNVGRQANVLKSLGDLERRLGNLDQARDHYDAALPLYRAERARLGEANVLRSLGDLERRLGNLDQARDHYDAALPLYRTERTRLGEANVYMSLGDMILTQKEWAQARTYYEQALPLFIVERDPLGQANTLIDLGLARFELGEHEQGMRDVQQAATLFLSVQDPEWVRRAELRLAQMRARLEQSEEVE